MNQKDTVRIGIALKWRSTFDPEKKYYQENIVSLYGSVFRCKVESCIGKSPLGEQDEKGHMTFANTDVWDVVVDMVDYYNKALDSYLASKETEKHIKTVEAQVAVHQQKIEELQKTDTVLSARIDKNTENLDTLTKDVYDLHSAANLSFSTNLIEKGVNANVTLTWKSTYKGVQITPLSSKITNKATNAVISTAHNSSTSLTISDETAFSFETEIVKGVTKSSTGTIKARYPMYFGSKNAETIDSAVVLAFNKQQIKESPSGSYSFSVGAGEYMWLCVPDGMTIKSVKSSGFDVPMQPVAVVAVANKGNYNCYRSSSKFTAQTVNITIA